MSRVGPALTGGASLHPLDGPVPNHRVPVEEQYRQRRPLLLPAEREAPIRLEDLQRAENPKIQLTDPPAPDSTPQPSTATHRREGLRPEHSVRC